MVSSEGFFLAIRPISRQFNRREFQPFKFRRRTFPHFAMNTKTFFLAIAVGLPTLVVAENSSTEMNLLRGRLEKQITEIRALDAEIQSLSNRLGREGTPLPRREPERPAPEPAPLPVEPTPNPPPTTPPAPNPPVEVRPAVPVNEVPPPPIPTQPPSGPVPPPMPAPVVAVNPQPIPTPPPLPVTPVPPPPTPPVVTIEPPAPPPAIPVTPAPPVERVPEPVAPPVAASSGEVTVQPGDTLSAIARANKTTVAALMKANPGLVPEKLRPGQKIRLSANAAGNVSNAPVASTEGTRPQPAAPPAVPSTPGSYVVQSGDTMHSIARRSGTTVDTLCRLNGIANPSTIQIGMKLKLPDGANVAPPDPSATPAEPVKPRPPTPGTHIVKPGDTLSSISRQTNTPLEELRRVNNLKDDVIHPGQSLKVRRGGSGESSSTPSGKSGASTRPATKAATAQGIEMAEYTVHLGDSIFSISKRYFLSREEVAAMNSLPVDAPLQEGQKIRLPASALIAARLTESESQGN
jgi:LysM repeat protein